MTIWYPDPATLTPPLHASLAKMIAKAISDGRLPKGTQLPTHRKMAEELGLSVHTISKAYDSLRRQKLIDGQVGRGSYVLDPDEHDGQPFQLSSEKGQGFDLSILRPVFSQQHADRFQQALRDLPEGLDPSYYLSCRPNVGHDAHRAAGVKWLQGCGLETSAERIIMTNGVSHGMSAALSALTRPGDTVVSSQITHHLLVSGCSYLGLNLAGLEVDAEGILPDALERYCREKSAKVLFLLPSLASPTAEMMPEQRRRDLVDVARRHDLHIIENDAFGPVVADRQVPVAMLAPERTIYLTTFSKCTVSGLRAGYMAAPEHLAPALTGRIVVFGWMATPLMCELATRWVLDGTAAELAQWQQRTLMERFEIAARELQGWQWRGTPSAPHLWLPLTEGWTTGTFISYARQLQVAVAPDAPFLAPKTPPQNAVRLSLGSIQDPERFQQAMGLIAGMLKRPPEGVMQLAY
ncbi:MocR-like ectoine utilization transcription factor EhuR [Epibacterium sp. Ofav1-8]|uniref:MocR-like ectoine utilization transcription factor EhuR n=1 Tax=Epibacterium sp. Ofav1-8 TaxID=2917735 RepID=UPI001EF70506|nr:PLP-dependent aminotransferase family protein [Epibacterium sp. Ofav1-8]MCG7624586.1 PLP-dependent aminotransferase family protein [Epibacterium sp. Ofav1-8]